LGTTPSDIAPTPETPASEAAAKSTP